MLTLQTGRPFADRVLVHVGDWHCPFCPFHRTFGTPAGALEGAGKHLKQEHHIRITLRTAPKVA